MNDRYTGQPGRDTAPSPLGLSFLLWAVVHSSIAPEGSMERMARQEKACRPEDCMPRERAGAEPLSQDWYTQASPEVAPLQRVILQGHSAPPGAQQAEEGLGAG